jgi:coiled-coil domain-containing protein 12
MEDRKARLKALAAKAGRAKPTEEEENGENQSAENDPSTNNNEEPKKRSFKFRNYTPADDALNKEETNDADQEQGDDEPSSKRAKTSSDGRVNDDDDKPKSKLEQALEKAKQEAKQGITANAKVDSSLTAMAPKKINWDLRRDIQPKLDKLEKRTQKALVQLLRERLANEADEDDDDDEAQDELD